MEERVELLLERTVLLERRLEELLEELLERVALLLPVVAVPLLLRLLLCCC